MLHGEGRHRAGACAFLFRGRARSALGGQKLLSRDYTRCMAANFARMPELAAAVTADKLVVKLDGKLHVRYFCIGSRKLRRLHFGRVARLLFE